MVEENAVVALWASLRTEQTRLRALLDEAGDIDLTGRPGGGGWSVLEVLRHLLFAEQAHLGRHDADLAGWSPLGYTPATMRDARKLGPREERQPSVHEVLAEWRAVHERIERTLRPRHDETVRAALQRNLRHLRAHINSIERTLRRSKRDITR